MVLSALLQSLFPIFAIVWWFFKRGFPSSAKQHNSFHGRFLKVRASLSASRAEHAWRAGLSPLQILL